MIKYSDIINSWETLGEVLAEFENRIGTLENSVSPGITEAMPTTERVRVTNLRMTDTQISYLRKNLIQYIDKKLKELQDKKKVDKQDYAPF